MRQPFLPGLPDRPAPDTTLVPHAELERLILQAISRGGGGLSRGADLFLATVCAATIAERLSSQGLAVVRLAEGPPAGAGQPGPPAV